MNNNQQENQADNDKLCLVCYIREADPSLVSDIKVCSMCFQITSKMMNEFKQSRFMSGKKYIEVSEIIKDKLYLGNEDTASSKKELQERGITHILVAGSQLEQYFKDDYTYLQLELADSINENVARFFNLSNKFIEEAKVVYVHCAAGVSRSASLVIAYLMNKNKWKFDDAFDYVKERRSVICPNSSFKKQLQEYEQILFLQQNTSENKKEEDIQENDKVNPQENKSEN